MNSRSALCGILIAACILPAAALAQDAEAAWKNLLMQALYAAMEKQYLKSETIFDKAVHEAERFGPQDARIGITLNSLGLVYKEEKLFAKAETVYRRALAILDKAYGAESVDVANVNFNLGGVLIDQNRQAAAMPYLQKALQTYESTLGGNSLKTASVMCLMGDAYRGMKEYSNSITNLKRCADIREADGGIQNPELAEALRSIALTYAAMGKFPLAESNFKLSEKIVESSAGIASPQLASTMEDHIGVLKQIGGKEQEIERLSRMAQAIRRIQASKAAQPAAKK